MSLNPFILEPDKYPTERLSNDTRETRPVQDAVPRQPNGLPGEISEDLVRIRIIDYRSIIDTPAKFDRFSRNVNFEKGSSNLPLEEMGFYNNQRVQENFAQYVNSSSRNNAHFPPLQRDERVVDSLEDALFVQFYNPITRTSTYLSARRFQGFDHVKGIQDILKDSGDDMLSPTELFYMSSAYRLLHNPELKYRLISIISERELRIAERTARRNQTDRERSGGFFPYLLKEEVPFSLARYGVFKLSEWEAIPKNKVNVNCLVECFKDTEYYEKLLSTISGKYTKMTKKDMTFIANIINYTIVVHRMRTYKTKSGDETKSKVMKIYYPSSNVPNDEIEKLREFHIGLYSNHYFIFEKVKDLYSNYIKKCGWKEGVKTYNVQSSPLDSLNLIRIIVEENFDDYLNDFSNELYKSIHAQDLSNDIICKGKFDTEKDSRLVKKKTNEDSIFSNVFLADIETTTNEKTHKPYLVCCEDEFGKNRKVFTGDSCVYYFLKFISSFQRPLIYFHNLGYNAKFLIKYLEGVNTIEPTLSRCVSLKGSFKKRFLTFHNFYELMPTKFANFQQIFDLESGKYKNFPYDLYTEESVKLDRLGFDRNYKRRLREIIPHDEYFMTDDKVENHREFLFHIDYAIDYCLQDIKTLREGYCKLKKWTRDDFNIDLDSVLTISSLMDKYVNIQGTFENIFELTGVCRTFIQQSIVGGRTAVSLHDKKYAGSKILNYSGNENDFNVEYDFDEVEQDEFVSEFVINP